MSLLLPTFRSIECESEEREKIHLDEKEKSGLVFCVYVRSPIDNYENMKSKRVEWTHTVFIVFVLSPFSRQYVYVYMYVCACVLR